MDKYAELKIDFEKLVTTVSSVGSRQDVENYVFSAVLKIWSGNVLYSPDYAALLSALSGEKFTIEQVVTAMGCCGDEERKLLVPPFLKKLVDLDVENGTHASADVISALNDLFAAAAMINGDFTVEEAGILSGIITDLTGYAESKGVSTRGLSDHRPGITDRKEDSYLQNDGLLAAAHGDRLKKGSGSEDKNEESGAITLHIELDLGSGNTEAEVSELKQADAGDGPAVKRPDENENETIDSLLAELDSLVGLDHVKQDVHSLMNFIKVAKIREQRGMKVPTISYHLVFTGNPGTGKTTVARLVAKLYYHMGILPQGQLVETDRSMLVAGYLGQTAIKTQKVIQQALGGVLFIDEAYSLANDAQDSYGKEAIETILKAMEDHRDELVVIVAGYTELMYKFIESNPGLSSRFSKYFEFPDYTADELLAIFGRFCKSNGYVLKEDAECVLKEKFEALYAARDEHFGNARTARNYFEKSINAQADRLAGKEQISDEELAEITADDIAAAIGGKA